MLVVTIASGIVVAVLAATGMGTDSQNAVVGIVFSLGLILGGLALRSTLSPAIQQAITARRVPWVPAVAIGLGMGLVFRIGAGIISQIGEAIDPSLCEKAKEATDIVPPEQWQRVLLAISLVILAPVGEELLFRGLMFRGFGKVWPLLPAALTAGVLFGLAHPQYYATWSLLISICAMGVVQCLLYRRWGYPTVVAAHLMFNLIPAVLILAGYDSSDVTCATDALITPLLRLFV